MVASQLKNLMPVGTAMRNVKNAKNGRKTAPVVNMWCAQTREAERADGAVASTNAR